MNHISEDFEVKPSLKVWAINVILFLAFLLVLLIAWPSLPDFPGKMFIWKVIVLSGSALLLYEYLEHHCTTYTLNSIELVGNRGVLHRKISRIPINRITNYDFRASLTHRLLGIGDVLIDTPGGTGYELNLRSISVKDSERVMKFLSLLIGQQKIADTSHNITLRTAVEEDLKADEQ